MLTRWLTLTAFLAGSPDPETRAAIGQGTLNVAPTIRVKGHPEVALTLNCGDAKNAGVVQYWHTPFGDLQTPGFLSNLDPVFMHHDGSLVVPNTSILHSGLYYCLLQHSEGTTLWPYELCVGRNNQKNHEHSEYEQRSGCDEFRFRFRRNVGSVEERQAGVSDGQFAGAVAASVLLTFVLGFSIGALTRTHVLRCLWAVTMRLRSPRQQRCQTGEPDRGGSEVTITALPPMYDNQGLEMEQVWDEDPANETMDTTISSTSSSCPAKPQRSFRQKRQEEPETTAYLEGCDYMEEEERRLEEVAGRSLEGNKECDVEEEEVEEEGEREFSGFYLMGDDGGSQTETDEDVEDKDGRESREEKNEWRQDEEVEETGEKGRDEKREEEEGGWRDEKGADDGEKKREEANICSKDDETDSKKQDTMKNEREQEPPSSPPLPGRRSRVIRLYQYDEDGQRYCHLPDAAPDEPGPAPRLKQRSLSLTRLNAIMAAATAGPLDTGETGREEREERPHFHMEI